MSDSLDEKLLAQYRFALRDAVLEKISNEKDKKDTLLNIKQIAGVLKRSKSSVDGLNVEFIKQLDAFLVKKKIGIDLTGLLSDESFKAKILEKQKEYVIKENFEEVKKKYEHVGFYTDHIADLSRSKLDQDCLARLLRADHGCVALFDNGNTVHLSSKHRGSEIKLGESVDKLRAIADCPHISYEILGAAYFNNISPKEIEGYTGALKEDDIDNAIENDDLSESSVKVLKKLLENTSRGKITRVPFACMKEANDIYKKYKDGNKLDQCPEIIRSLGKPYRDFQKSVEYMRKLERGGRTFNVLPSGQERHAEEVLFDQVASDIYDEKVHGH